MGFAIENQQTISAADFKAIQHAAVSPTNKNAAKITEMLNKAADGGFSEAELRDVAKLIREGTPKGGDPNAEVDKFVDGMKLSDPKLAASLKFEMKDAVDFKDISGNAYSLPDVGSDHKITTFVSAAPVTGEAAKVAAAPNAISFEAKPAEEAPAVTAMAHNRSNGVGFKFEGEDMEITPDHMGGFTAEGSSVGPVLEDPAARKRLADGIEAAAKNWPPLWKADADAIVAALRTKPETIKQ